MSVSTKKLSICFVCLGNICRSPMAEGVLNKLLAEAGLRGRIRVDSCGTGGWHKGERADKRARGLAASRGYELNSVARQITEADFSNFDLLIGMDQNNLRDISAIAPDAKAKTKIKLLRNFDPLSPKGAEIPDPYYGSSEDFTRAFEVIEVACKGLLNHLRGRYGL